MNNPLTNEIWNMLEAAETDEEWDRICEQYGVTAAVGGAPVIQHDPAVPPMLPLGEHIPRGLEDEE